MAKARPAPAKRRAAPPAPAPASVPTPAPEPVVTQVRLPRRAPTPRPEYHAFATKLREAMRDRHKSASDLARDIWGTATDYRGYPVARNRDRIGHYLAGVSYPEPENLKKLADALSLSVDDLAVDLQARGPIAPTREIRGMGDVQVTILDSRPGTGFITMKRLLSMHTILQIMALINADRLPDPNDPNNPDATIPGTPETIAN